MPRRTWRHAGDARWRAGLVFCLLAAPAVAHAPIVIDGGPTDAETAYEISDVAVSQVAYHEATENKPVLWLTFEADAGSTLYLQLGVPYLERYEGLRPAMALLGPGMPEIHVPFGVPDGYGGWRFTTEGQAPVVFNEEFTGTLSWQFPAVRCKVPASGRYYLVGYLPNADEGKFWMVVGTLERFGLMDILTLPMVLSQVRAFHEVGPFGGILFWVMIGGIALLLFLVGLLML